MTSGQKVALSLLLTIFLFAGFVVFAFSGVFSLIETRFYQPSLINGINEDLTLISKSYENYTKDFENAFTEVRNNAAVKKVSNPTQKNEDIQERSKLFSDLASEFSGLLGYRVVDTNGKAIHYSTFDSDILKQQSNAISYRNYDNKTDFPYEKLALDGIYFDTEKNQLIFSFPYFNEYDTNQGRIFFYVAAKDFNQYLISKNLLAINQNAVLIETSKTGTLGFIYGYPSVNQEFFKSAVAERWNQNLFSAQTILDTEIGNWVAISNNGSAKIIIAKIEKESFFVFSETVKILLLACVFISIYLIFFLLFNLRQDPMVKIKHKIKKFQLAFVNQYLEKENIENWENLKKEIDKRKNDLSKEVKKSLGVKSKKHSKEIDSFLNKSWEDLLSVLTSKTAQNPVVNYGNNVNMEEIKTMLEQILSSGVISVNQDTSISQKNLKIEKVVEIEELDEVEEIAEIEVLDEVEEIVEIDELDEVEEIAEIEELDEIEEIAEIEELDEVEEIAEIDELDEVEEIAEIEELDEVEEIAEIEELDEVEEIAEIEKLDEVEEIAETEETVKSSQIKEVDVTEELFNSEEIVDVKKLLEPSQNSERTIIEVQDLEEEPVQVNIKSEFADNIEEKIESFNIVKPDFSILDEREELPIEEAEPVSDLSKYFSFTNYNYSKVVEELTIAESDSSSIEEKNGIFHIKQNIDTSSVKQDLSFKELVDSVMK